MFDEEISGLKSSLEKSIAEYGETSKNLNTDGLPNRFVGLNFKGDRVYLQYTEGGKRFQKPLGKKRYVGLRKLRHEIEDHNKILKDRVSKEKEIASLLRRIRKLTSLSNSYDEIIRQKEQDEEQIAKEQRFKDFLKQMEMLSK